MKIKKNRRPDGDLFSENKGIPGMVLTGTGLAAAGGPGACPSPKGCPAGTGPARGLLYAEAPPRKPTAGGSILPALSGGTGGAASFVRERMIQLKKTIDSA